MSDLWNGLPTPSIGFLPPQGLLNETAFGTKNVYLPVKSYIKYIIFIERWPQR